VVAVAVLLAVSGWLAYAQLSSLQVQIKDLQDQNSELESQISDLQKQTSILESQHDELVRQTGDLTKQLALERRLRVEIVDLWHRGHWSAYGGLLVSYPFNVTIRNNDVITMSGLSLNVRTYSGLKDVTMVFNSIEINTLVAGEERVVQGHAVVSISAPINLTYVATLKAGEVILDEFTLP
jgi:hypothetical protein